MQRAKYTEPDDFFPKSVRKEAKIGEYAETNSDKEKEKKEKRDLNDKFRDFIKGSN